MATKYANEFSKIISGYPAPDQSHAHESTSESSSQTFPLPPFSPPQHHNGAAFPAPVSSKPYYTSSGHLLLCNSTATRLTPSLPVVNHRIRTPEVPRFLLGYFLPQAPPTSELQFNPTLHQPRQRPIYVPSPHTAEDGGNGDWSPDVRQVPEVHFVEYEFAPPPQEPSGKKVRKVSKSSLRTSLLAQLIRHDPIAVIREMILSSPDQRLKLGGIRTLLRDRYPQLRDRKDWDGKLRHHLSVQNEFIKGNGYAAYWSVDTSKSGKKPRGSKPRQQRKKKTTSSPTSYGLSNLLLTRSPTKNDHESPASVRQCTY